MRDTSAGRSSTIRRLVPAALCLLVAAIGCKPKAGPATDGKGAADGLSCKTCGSKPLKASKLLADLPDDYPTPDGMAMDADGNIVVACPNYADKEKPVAERRPAVFMKISPDNKVTKWFECPVMEESGIACPMGIAFGPDGDLYVCDNQNWPTGNGKNGERNEGRILRLRIDGNRVVKTTVVAHSISHPNGVRVRDGHLYVTVSMLPKIKSESGCLVSAVYKFALDDRGVAVANTKADPNLLIAIETKNMDCQYGLDGIVFDKAGNLYLGNFGDGTLHKVTFDARGKVASEAVFAKSCCMRTTDGICIDDAGNIYVADFSENALCVVSPAGKVKILAKSPDCDGSKGGLDQPGEPIVRGNELVVSCFDMVTGPDKVNLKHDRPYTMAVISLDGVR